jgi:tetratricopeptide (TPR) repeat protein
LQARLHLELAVIYTQRYETHIALGHGQMAYAGWHSLQNSVEMARTAFVLSDAYRMAKKPEKAEVFLELASSLFTQLEYGPSYCLIAYEQGLLYLQHRKYEAAQQWFMIALEEGFRLNHAYYIAMSRHSLGIAQTELHQYTNAEANLKAAIPLWEQLENWFYLTNTYHALGYLEGRKGNIVLAENRLKKALIISTKIPDLAVRQWIEQWIIDTIAELK